MNQDSKLNFTPDDPRLTAYAHGELRDPAEREALEAQLTRDPELKAALEEIQALSILLGDSFANEPLPKELAIDPFAANRQIEALIERQSALQKKKSRGETIRFYLYGAAALAACAAFIFGSFLHQAPEPVAPIAAAPVAPAPVVVNDPGNAIMVDLIGPTVPSDAAVTASLFEKESQSVVVAEPRVPMVTEPDLVMPAETTHLPEVLAGEQALVALAGQPPAKREKNAPVSPVDVATGNADDKDMPAVDRLVSKSLSPSIPIADELASIRQAPLSESIKFGSGEMDETGAVANFFDTPLFNYSPEETGLVVHFDPTDTSWMTQDEGSGIIITKDNLQAKGGVPRGLGHRRDATVGGMASANQINVDGAIRLVDNSGTDETGAWSGYGAKPNGTIPDAEEVYPSCIDASTIPNYRTPPDAARDADSPLNTEQYDLINDNTFKRVTADPVSTFSVDVDTGSYSNVRRFLYEGRLPPSGAVRIEEMMNYFSYDYAPPSTPETPFALHLAQAPAPWATEHKLVRVALKGYEVSWANRPASNIVFLVDVSGSMNEINKLPLIRYALTKLVQKLDARDTVTIVTYAGEAGLRLRPTQASEKNMDTILSAIQGLKPGGTTQGSAGIQLAYAKAQAAFIKGGTNRVILCTDGDFNVGITDRSELSNLITEKARSGVFLSVFGFGRGNYKDATLEELARKGNGNYGYIDSTREANLAFVDRASRNLMTIAKDVKIQVEFNPDQVAAYRLIGYENRMMVKEDFKDDSKDAGEIGAGHTVTALYEIIPVGTPLPDTLAEADKLIYQNATTVNPEGHNDLFTIKLRYKEPDGEKSRLIETSYAPSNAGFTEADDDFRFATAVAAFGMLLRDSPDRGAISLQEIRAIALAAKGRDRDSSRLEFIDLLKRAAPLIKERAARATSEKPDKS